jgi:hypothetical protein
MTSNVIIAPTTIAAVERDKFYPVSVLMAIFGWKPATLRSKRRTGAIHTTADGKLVLGSEIWRFAGPGAETFATPEAVNLAKHRDAIHQAHQQSLARINAARAAKRKRKS